MMRTGWLRSYLAAMLVITVLVTFAVVGTTLLLVRLPQIEQSNKYEVARDTEELAQRVALLLGSLESRVQVLGQVLETLPLEQANVLLDRTAWAGRDFRAVYLASNNGLVLAAGTASTLREHRADVLGSDLSGNALFTAALASHQTVWGDKYLSALTGAVTVGLATPVGHDRILLAEVPLDYVLNTVQVAAGKRTSTIWLLDQYGEVVANTQDEHSVGTVNLLNVPLMRAVRENQILPALFQVDGRTFHPAVARSAALNWYFIGGIPAGLENSEVRGTLAWVVASFAGAVLVALLMAPFWASWLTRPLGRIVDSAAQITQGAVVGAWPRSRILEFNNLSVSLETMALTLQELNIELEARVAHRTEALATANEELSGAITTLRATQGELVRAEKMAALGGLVAGVAHELNTPLGNGLMAVTSLSDEVRQFRVTMQTGLRKAALESLLASVEQATNMTTRNLHRASDLVSSFKQVAVDQTSAQRRPFELHEVVDEMVVSLRPSISRTPYQIVVAVAPGLKLDSYPGALGQTIGNLINNAVLHGFEGRAHGTIRITGVSDAEEGDCIMLSVADDGRGIPAALLAQIFDPFMTTKMGRGGTGLGLHIAYNAVTHLLGGSLTVCSVEGEGATFMLRLPRTAPKAINVGV